MEVNCKMEEKKKQKAGLNAVRPDDWMEDKFKNMAKDQELTQTEMFSRIFYTYLDIERTKDKQECLDVSSEVSLISENLNSILSHFKSVVSKAQLTIGIERENGAQVLKNTKSELETYKLKIEEYSKRNEELEKSNEAFNDVKLALEEKIKELVKINEEKEEKLNNQQSEILELYKVQKASDKEILVINKDLEKKDADISKLEKHINEKDIRIEDLNRAVDSLSNNLKTIESINKNEITSIERQNTRELDSLKSSIEKEKESIRKEFEVENKLILAESKLEILDVKGKYQELLKEFNELSAKYKILAKEKNIFTNHNKK